MSPRMHSAGTLPAIGNRVTAEVMRVGHGKCRWATSAANGMISMVARSNELLQPEAGYIDARPTTRMANSLATTIRGEVWQAPRTPAREYPSCIDSRLCATGVLTNVG